MTTPNYLIDAIIGKATIALRINQDENGGIVDFERFQEEMSIFLMPVEKLQQTNSDLDYECNKLIASLKKEVACRKDAEEQAKSAQQVCRDLQNGKERLYTFDADQLN